MEGKFEGNCPKIAHNKFEFKYAEEAARSQAQEPWQPSQLVRGLKTAHPDWDLKVFGSIRWVQWGIQAGLPLATDQDRIPGEKSSEAKEEQWILLLVEPAKSTL